MTTPAVPIAPGNLKTRRLLRTRVSGGLVGWLKLGVVAALLVPSSCKKAGSGATVGPDQASAGAKGQSWERPPKLKLDQARMKQGIEQFSADEMQGRFTLSPSIEKAAQWLVDQYKQAAIAPAAGGAYIHRYALATGVTQQGPAKLVFKAGGKLVSVPTADFSPASQGGSGDIEGQVVFVGYGIQGDEDGKTSSLQDFRGLDLNGKVALLLAGAPGELDMSTMMARAEALALGYTQDMAAAKSPSEAARKNMHMKARKAMAQTVAPYLSAKDLPPTYLDPSIPAPATLTGRELMGPLWPALMKARERRGVKRSVSLYTKLLHLKEAGAAGALVVRGPASFLDHKAYDQDELPKLVQGQPMLTSGLPTLHLHYQMADKLLSKQGVSLAQLQTEIDKDQASHSQVIPGLVAKLSLALEFQEQKVPNVLAVVPGSDLAQEIVVVGAHFDHIGTTASKYCHAAGEDDAKDQVCNGADDNASGTVALIELARALASAPQKPRRTVVFAHFSGEELGLFGSRALVQNAPIELGKVVAMINVDMIGRLGDKELKIGGLATSKSWLSLLDGIGHHGVSVLYDASSTYRSDHAAFVEQQIPALFFFSGIHDEYHRPGDEAAKIDMPSYRKIAAMIGELVSTLAQGAPIAWSTPAPGKGLVRDLPGENPDNIVKRVPGASSR